jgi:hypothetical protein
MAPYTAASQVIAPHGRAGRGMVATAAMNNWSGIVRWGAFEPGTDGPTPTSWQTVSIGSGQR